LSLIFGEHRGYLADVARLGAFRRALDAVIRPGDVVLDLGTGTGVLGCLAAQAGASRVYAVDASSMAAVARSVVKANGLDDRITVLREHSLRMELPEQVDVVVADQLGAFGVEAGVFECFADARARHLKPTGTLLPSAVDLVVAPLSSADLWDDVSFWDQPAAGIDVSAVSRYARNVRYYVTAGADQLLGPPVVAAHRDPGDPGATPIDAQVVLPVERAGTVHAVAGWFSAQLTDSIAVTNSPLAPDRVCRSHIALPLATPVAVAPGAAIELTLHVQPPDLLTRWEVTVRDGSGAQLATSRHSTLEGVPLSREDLARTRPDHVPRLSPQGEARRTTLSLLDGERTVAEIEAAVFAAHTALFGSPDGAAAFVARVLSDEVS
jgi:protein arginine N-methyltransferase 1